jgi:hypothetical protein
MTDIDRRLSHAFRNPPADAPRGPGCPPADRSLEVVLGQVSASEREAFAAHAATCAACAAEWRLARAFAEESGSKKASTPWRWIAAAAAVVVVALVAVLLPRPSGESGPPVFREAGGPAVTSRVPDGATLPRGAFSLRWDAPGPGFRYDLRVFDGRLQLLHEESGLTVPEATVPAEAFAPLPSDAVVLWQVEAIGPDGSRLVSETYRARLAP